MSAISENRRYCSDLVRTSDHERYLTTLFAGRSSRRGLWTLLAFNQEVAKIRENVNELALGEIRLKWWQEVLQEIEQGEVRKQPVIAELAALYCYADVRPLLLETLQARTYEMAAETKTDFAALKRYAYGSGGALHEAMLLLSADQPVPSEAVLAARSAGAAWTMMGLIRALPYHWQAGRNMLPEADEAAMQMRNSEQVYGALRPTIKRMVDYVESQFNNVIDLYAFVPKEARVSILCVSLVQLHLDALKKVELNPFHMGKSEAGDLRKISRLFWCSFSGRLYAG